MKCTGLMGRIFGHKFKVSYAWISRAGVYRFQCKVFQCQRCGAVTREKK